MNDSARKLVAAARATNKSRDELERNAGFAAPGDSGSEMLLRVAQDAIACGMSLRNWDAVAEGYVMLVDLHKALTGKPYDPIEA